jgi:hypothetical protein
MVTHLGVQPGWLYKKGALETVLLNRLVRRMPGPVDSGDGQIVFNEKNSPPGSCA